MTLDTRQSPISKPSPAHVGIVPIFVDYNITQITPHVFVTAEDTARQFQQIFSNGIGCVINVADELPQIVYPPQSGIESLKFPIKDNPAFPVYSYFDTVADRIAANVASNRRTLLYCHHGRSRSVTLILAYLIKHHRMPLPIAYAIVKQRRQLALPNVGFWSQLNTYESLQRRYYQPYSAVPAISSAQPSPIAGDPLLQKLASGIEQMVTNNPLMSVFAYAMQQAITQKSPPWTPHYRTVRRRPAPYYSSYGTPLAMSRGHRRGYF